MNITTQTLNAITRQDQIQTHNVMESPEERNVDAVDSPSVTRRDMHR